MSTYTVGVNDALAVKLWSARMDVEALKETVAYEYMGSGAGNLCQLMTETQKSAGDSVRWGIRMLATGEGTTENQTQEGNEESLTRYHDTMLINELGHAHRVRAEGTIDAQRVPYNMREECFDSLRDWYADRIDTCFFNQIAGNDTTPDLSLKYTGFNPATPPTATRIFRGGAVATDELMAAAAQKFTLSLIDKAVNRAKTTTPMLRPIKGLGKDLDYVLFIHPDQTLDLRADTATAGNWFDLQGKRLQGGDIANNGLYTGALGVYNRTLIVENFRVPQGVNSTTGVPVANTRRAIFCGAQAASWAYGKSGGKTKYKWVEELFDYERELGVRASSIFGCKKTVYNSVDYGTIVIGSFSAPAA